MGMGAGAGASASDQTARPAGLLYYGPWRTQAEVDRQYDVVHVIGPAADQYLWRMMQEALRVRRSWRMDRKQRYGQGRLEFMDIYHPQRPQPDRPPVVFFRGGFRTSFDLRQFSFVGEAFLNDGHPVVLLNYDGFVAQSFTPLRRQIQQAMGWLWAAGPSLGLDTRRIIAASHCTGGLLAGTCVLDTLALVPAPEIVAWIGLGSMYDPTFMLYTSPRAIMGPQAPADIRGIDWDSIPNPVRQWCRAMPPLLALVGARDSAEMQAQAHSAAAAAAAAGTAVTVVHLEGHDHLSILLDLLGTGGPGYRAIRDFLDALTRQTHPAAQLPLANAGAARV